MIFCYDIITLNISLSINGVMTYKIPNSPLCKTLAGDKEDFTSFPQHIAGLTSPEFIGFQAPSST